MISWKSIIFAAIVLFVFGAVVEECQYQLDTTTNIEPPKPTKRTFNVGFETFEVNTASDGHDYYQTVYIGGVRDAHHYIDCKLCLRRNGKDSTSNKSEALPGK